MTKTFQVEGVAGLYKGLLGNIYRQGPHMALAFLFLSQLKQGYGHIFMRPKELDQCWDSIDQNHDGKVCCEDGVRSGYEPWAFDKFPMCRLQPNPKPQPQPQP